MTALNLFRHAADARTFAPGETIFAAGEQRCGDSRRYRAARQS